MRSEYTVTQVNTYIKNMFTQDFLLKSLTVKGEVSNCKYHSSGHIYFTIKDNGAALACVMFSSDRTRGLTFQMKEGQQVKVTGSVSVYERDGKYQLYARKIEPDGAGVLYERYEELKKRLQESGMFSEEYKQPIPKYIRTLGVVTAPTGAAVRDIINVATRRNPHIQIILYPAIVQGEKAAESIVKGIETLSCSEADVIIVGRGGGSIEDLWAFNEEAVARAIFKSKIPVISCVGHEVDFTIADFVADLRAPTPSAAAELVVKNSQNTQEHIVGLQKRLLQAVHLFYERAKRRFDLAVNSPVFKRPAMLTQNKEQLLDDLTLRLEQSFALRNAYFMQRFEIAAQKLRALGPQAVLKRGYSITRKQDGTVISRVNQTQSGEEIYVQVRDGMIYTKVK